MTKVIRTKHENKARGFGFVSFMDPMDCAKAIREMQGKYLGTRYFILMYIFVLFSVFQSLFFFKHAILYIAASHQFFIMMLKKH